MLELRLRTAGLRVLSEDENRKDPDVNPCLELTVGSIRARIEEGTYIGFAYRLDLSARTYSLVGFNQALAQLVLWEDGTMGVGSTDTASNRIEQMVGELADSFLNDWLRANPRK
jgi:hypothetical protein